MTTARKRIFAIFFVTAGNRPGVYFHRKDAAEQTTTHYYPRYVWDDQTHALFTALVAAGHGAEPFMFAEWEPAAWVDGLPQGAELVYYPAGQKVLIKDRYQVYPPATRTPDTGEWLEEWE